jgi:hypothetical protein
VVIAFGQQGVQLALFHPVRGVVRRGSICGPRRLSALPAITGTRGPFPGRDLRASGGEPNANHASRIEWE